VITCNALRGIFLNLIAIICWIWITNVKIGPIIDMH